MVAMGAAAFHTIYIVVKKKFNANKSKEERMGTSYQGPSL